MLSVPDALAVNMEAAFFSEVLVNFCYNAQRHRLEDSAPHSHPRDNTNSSSPTSKIPLI